MTLDELKTEVIDFLRIRDGWTDIIMLTKLTSDYNALTKIIRELEKEKKIIVILQNKRNKLIKIC